MRRSIILSAIMLFTAIIGSSLFADDQWHTGSATESISTTAVAICTAPTAIEAFRIDPTRKAESQGPKISGYSVIGHGKTLDKDFAARLGGILADDKTYRDNVFVGCFEPGIAFRMHKGDESATFIICLHCGNMHVMVGNEFVGGEPVFENETPLVKLAKEAFPDDPKIQALKEDGSEN